MAKPVIPALLSLSITSLFSQMSPVSAIEANSTAAITDRIVLIRTRSGQGSGVIIKHTGNTYTILTAAHVVNDLRSSPLQITTADRQKYTTKPSQVRLSTDRLDLATISFQSDRSYPVAILGNSDNVIKGQPIFAAGFQGDSLKFHPGTVVAISHQSQELGYGLAIGTADILPGMSGGGLFDRSGILVGINGKSVGKIEVDPTPSTQNINTSKPVSGLAIPINTFTQVASKLNVDITTPTPALKISALTADDLFIRAGSKSQKGDYHGAIDDYNRALALNPQFGEVYFRRGIARSLIKDWQGAEVDYTQAIALKPGYAEAYLQRGSIRNTLNNWSGARSDFNVVVALKPNDLAAYVGRGVAVCELNDCQEGVKDYDRAIAINPSYADAYSRKGFAYYRSGNRQIALDNYLVAADLYRKQGKDRDYLETVQKIRQIVRG
jgi:S1-C subfamily serine protease/lipoprotein NlpI